ncbi:hypothetical protein ABH944_001555 [Caballeronia udeis]|jgi:hypothetical protein|uniref:Transglycosylase SLT domain-containing protein n=2 Tax=Caballeronia udeis TaxID=1232866 RepID=A0ABW8MDY2_9BURK
MTITPRRMTIVFALAACPIGAHASGIAYVIGGSSHVSSMRNVSFVVGGTRTMPEPAVEPLNAQARAHGAVLAGPALQRMSWGTFKPDAGAACVACRYADWAPAIQAAAASAAVDPALVAAVIDVESRFHVDAISPRGARGLMQLMPATALRFGVSDTADPVQNLSAGTRYLGQLIAQFSGDLPKAIAAYNAGEGAVNLYGGIPPFRETQAYVPEVLSRYALYQSMSKGSMTDPHLALVKFK